MLLKIRHAVLEVTNAPNTKKSAIIINNEIIITSGCILQPYVRPILPFIADNTNESICASTKIIRKLQQCQLVNAQDEQTDEAVHLNSLNYQVTFDRKKLPQSDRKQGHILTRYQARLLYLFSSKEISRVLHKFMVPASATALTNDTQYENSDNNEVLLSSFLVLTIKPNSNRKEKETFERFLLHTSHYLRYISPLKALDDVLVMCTPFGLENFYKTVSIGKISNVMERNGSLFLISNALPLGCEGSAVFNNKLRLIGIIVCTSFQRNNENVNLTLAANFPLMLRSFMTQLGYQITTFDLPKEPSHYFTWERTMVVIEADGLQGTGTFVKVYNKKFILTCSHVLFQVNSKVHCRSVDGEFESDVLWSNPQYSQAFDVALIDVPVHVPESYCVRLSNSRPILGQTVYNAGFPYFVDFHLKYDFNPSIFQGRIIKYTPGAAIMSDGCVQAGQSGGPMFDENGYLMGVCVSNLKVDEVIYPNINTAVPIHEIKRTLVDYAKTNDVSVLNNLVANQEVQRIWALEAPPILSKL